MKKLIYIIPLILLLALLAACGAPEETTAAPEPVLPVSIWDGSVASSFAGGDGSEVDPYRIESAAQLAYLAAQVNSGEEYTDKHFVLKCDIDLNNIAWTPIGSGNIDRYYFEGHFDGCGATISNLKIDKLLKQKVLTSIASQKCGVGGLFGACQNATICNLNINNACVFVDNSDEHVVMSVGILVGYVSASSSCLISNINITNSKISLQNTEELNGSTETAIVEIANIGGVFGGAILSKSAQVAIDNVKIDLVVSCENACGIYNHVGTVGGDLSTGGMTAFECSDFDSDLSFKWNMTRWHFSSGAFGIINNLGMIELSNGFSEIKVNHKNYDDGWLSNDDGWLSASTNAIIGSEFNAKAYEDFPDKKCVFENLFGNVSPIDENADFAEPILNLYTLNGNDILTEINCKGCTALPEGHGFDTSIWDVVDPAKPILK